MTSKQIRQQFLDFFKSKGHVILESSPVVPHDDPTLMFTNAGMNQFKPIFLGTVAPNSEFARLKRAADTQKCIRAGGKHNDLDDVGQDTYHHTFFEMLGNWSFGDYFKKEAIEWAWELLTKVWGIDKSRLHATYFQGDPAEGLEPDSEAAELWRTVTDINPRHIHPGNKKDNFWEMGDTGPCGPCSEVHIDLTPDKSGRDLVNKGDARVMEMWNLVFIQFNRRSDSKLTPLPAKHVDTGMGFERLCAVLQGMSEPQVSTCATSPTSRGEAIESSRGLKPAAQVRRVSNYDTDVFAPIFAAIQRRTGAPDYKGTLPSDTNGPRTERDPPAARQETPPNPPLVRGGETRASSGQIMTDVSYRVIADHIRCLTFALTDGAVPSNEGRGYVLRRILRRAVRYGRQYLNMHEPFLCDLVEPLVAHMGDAFPELRSAHRGKNIEHVKEMIRDEEASFLKTLDRGMRLFESFEVLTRAFAGDEQAIASAKRIHPGWDHPGERDTYMKAGQNVLPGAAAFKLYDTYGFPIDLTQQMASERNLTVDYEDFERRLEEAKEKARSSTKETVVPTVITGPVQATAVDLQYWSDTANALVKIVGFVVGDTYFAKGPIPPGIELAIVTSGTCFYPEQGGQVGDSGRILLDGKEVFTIRSAKWYRDSVLHIGQLTSSEVDLQVDHEVWLQINDRSPVRRNHTSTHVLNWALREVLCPSEERENPHLQQKGSLVDAEKTRFDFSHSKQVSAEEIDRIESLVKEQIDRKLPVYTAEVDQAKARQINTLRAVFGEKYPDHVRVVSIGVPVTEEDAKAAGLSIADTLLGNPKNPKWMNYSVEFCGGTHVGNTRDIESFVLTHEEGVAKGVRRVVGISGDAAKRADALGKQLLTEVETLAGMPPVAPRMGTAYPEPQASACANSQSTGGPGEFGPSRGLKPAAQTLADRLAEFQHRLAEAVIPLRVRNQIRERVAELQKIAKEEGKQAAAESGHAVMDAVAKLFAPAQTVDGTTIVVGEVPAANPDALRAAIDWVRNKTPASAVLLGYVSDSKVTLMAGMSKAVVEKGIKAGDLIKEISPLVGGKGGGRPDMAQGGGPDSAGLPNALAQSMTWLNEKLA